jgi:uncharacterized membrane protein YkoI
MKLLITLLLPIVAFASGEKLSPSEHNSIHGYNNRPLIKMAKKRNMHKLHKVDEKQAKKIVKDETKEEVISLKLTHQGRHLIYKAKTQQYSLTINALDGTIISKSR